MKIIVLSIIFVFTFASQMIAQSILKNSEIPKDLVIKLERTPCFGTCPVYELTIKFNGTVIFKRNKRGFDWNYSRNNRIVKSKISQEAVKNLITEFEKAEFLKLNGNYFDEKNCSGVYLDDAPSEIITIRINNINKQIKHDFGCINVEGNALERIINLGEKIDEVTNSKRWIRPISGLRFPPKKKV